jgi:predicted DNA binding CopG/RHH family protein
MEQKKLIQVKFTDEQFEMIKNYTSRVGLPPSSFIRFMILKKIQEDSASA